MADSPLKPSPWDLDSQKQQAKPAADAQGLKPSPWDSSPAPSEESMKPSEHYRITQEKINQIAAENKVDPEWLSGTSQYLAGATIDPKRELSIPEAAKEGLKEAVGTLQENALLGIPEYLYKKNLSDNQKRAISQLHEEVNKNKSGLDIVTDLGAGLIPAAFGGKAASGIVKAAGGGAKLAQAAGIIEPALQGTIQGYTTAAPGEELKQAAEGGAINLVMGMLMHAGFKGGEAAKNKLVDTFVKKEGARVLEKVETARAPMKELDSQIAAHFMDSEKAPLPQFVQHIEKVPTSFKSDPLFVEMSPDEVVQMYNKSKMNQEILDFGNHVNSTLLGSTERLTDVKAAEQVIREARATSPLKMGEVWNNFKDVEMAYKIMPEDWDNMRTPKGRFLERAVMWLSDNRPMAGFIDKRNGTSLQVTLDDLSTANKKFTLQMMATIPFKKELAADLQKVDGKKVIQAMRAGAIDSLSSEEQAVANKLKDVFELRRKQANDLGMKITKQIDDKGKEVPFYVPDQMVDPTDAVAIMRQKTREVNAALGTDINNLTAEEFPSVMAKLKEDHDEFLAGLRIVTHYQDVESSLGRFTGALNASNNLGKASELMDISASAAFQKQGLIPDFLKEKDPLQLLNNWERDTFRAAYYSDGLEKLRTMRSMYLATGDKNAASMVGNLVKDLTGRQRNTLGNWTRDALGRIAINAKDQIKQGNDTTINRMFAEAPDFFLNISNQVYPNFLAWNPRTVVNNLTQPLMMGLPELGPLYGGGKFISAYTQAAKDISKGVEIVLTPQIAEMLGKEAGETITTRNLGLVLKNQGIIGENWNSELVKVYSNSLNEGAGGKLLSLAGHMNERLNNAGMSMFNGSEVINRYTTDKVGRSVAKDFLAGNQNAISFFNDGLSAGYKREILAARNAGDFQRVEDLFAQHLTAKTQFNYDRITMSEAGRWLGPGLAAFIKWPTAIAGDIASKYMEHGVKGGSYLVGRRYIAPVVALSIVEHMLKTNAPDVVASGPYQTIFGKEGLTKGAPLNTMKDILAGKVAKPPAVSAATELGLGSIEALRGDPEKLWKWTNNTLYSFAPQQGLVRFLTNDVPQVMTGEKPEGTHLGKIQKALTGENRLDEFFKKERE